jgi:xanthosine utilization system XapX-like protein
MTLLAATQVVSGGISILGLSVPVIAIIAFLLGIYVGKKVL